MFSGTHWGSWNESPADKGVTVLLSLIRMQSRGEAAGSVYIREGDWKRAFLSSSLVVNRLPYLQPTSLGLTPGIPQHQWWRATWVEHGNKRTVHSRPAFPLQVERDALCSHPRVSPASSPTGLSPGPGPTGLAGVLCFWKLSEPSKEFGPWPLSSVPDFTLVQVLGVLS